jgi:hypothetical protein
VDEGSATQVGGVRRGRQGGAARAPGRWRHGIRKVQDVINHQQLSRMGRGGSSSGGGGSGGSSPASSKISIGPDQPWMVMWWFGGVAGMVQMRAVGRGVWVCRRRGPAAAAGPRMPASVLGGFREMDHILVCCTECWSVQCDARRRHIR